MGKQYWSSQSIHHLFSAIASTRFRQLVRLFSIRGQRVGDAASTDLFHDSGYFWPSERRSPSEQSSRAAVGLPTHMNLRRKCSDEITRL
jgi:hypothetical protein